MNIRALSKSSLLIAALVGGNQAHAWIPCTLICDTQCMGLSFDVGTMNTLVSFETVTANLNSLATNIGQSTAAMSTMSQTTAANLNTTAININNVLNVDMPLLPSLASREVKAIDGMTINVKSAVEELSETLNNNTLEISNTISQAAKTFSTLERKALDRRNTSDVFDALTQNSYEISKHFETKQQNISVMLEKSAANDVNIRKLVKGKGEIKRKEVQLANQLFEDMTFSLAAPDAKESWEYTPLIAETPSALSTLTTDFRSISKTKEYRVLDSQRIFAGSEIDLQALNVTKSQRRNLYLYELMQSANFSVGARDE